MEQNSTSSRLHAFDGIRGLAMILVFLNHINGTFIVEALPPVLRNNWDVIFSNGVTGVSLLFVLSGFFMAYIYPNPPSNLAFLQKRYTRIFPLFLTMCTIMFIFHLVPNLQWYLRIVVILGLAAFTHVIWVYGVKKIASIKLNRLLLISFLVLQVFFALFYVFWIMRHPPIVFNQQLPAVIREGTIWLVNATVTLPFGDYIPMLDGVYWSLASEVFFYVLYPIIAVPIISSLIPQNRKVKIAFLLALLPLFAGLDMLSHKILVLSMWQLPLFYYFATGITLGYLFRNHPKLITKTHEFFKGHWAYIPVILFVLVILFKPLAFHFVTRPFDPWIHLLWAIPVTVIMAMALDHETKLGKFFSSKFLVFIGTISYSIYLSHVPIIKTFDMLFHPTNTITNILYLLFLFAVTTGFATLLYTLLEKPYFMRKKDPNKSSAKQTQPARIISYRHAAIVLASVCIIYLAGIFIAYQSQFNFFSIEYPLHQNIFTSPLIKPGQTNLSMEQFPKVELQIPGQQDNFEIITMHITHQSDHKRIFKPQNLIFRMKDSSVPTWQTMSTYQLSEIGDSASHPFGFPIIQDSKGKTYNVELSLTNPKSSEYLTIDTTDGATKTVYKVNKSDLFKHPGQLISFTLKRIENVFYTPEARFCTVLFLPFAVFVILLIVNKKLALRKAKE